MGSRGQKSGVRWNFVAEVGSQGGLALEYEGLERIFCRLWLSSRCFCLVKEMSFDFGLEMVILPYSRWFFGSEGGI